MNFTEYLWLLMTGAVKKKLITESELYKILNAFGNIMQDIRESIFLIRRQGLILTAKGKALELHGKGRKISRYKDESDNEYRKRILYQPEIAKKSGTSEGILLALYSIGCTNTNIFATYLRDPEKWAEFDLILDENCMDARSFELIKSTVLNVKTASSKPNYGFRLYMGLQQKEMIKETTRCINRLKVNAMNEEKILLDDTRVLDGSWRLVGKIVNKKICNDRITNTVTINNTVSINKFRLIEKRDLYFLDGSWTLDGSRTLKVSVKEEEI